MKYFHAINTSRHGASIVAAFVISLFCTACSTQQSESVGDLASVDRECRTTKTVGSKMRQSVCLTKEEWERVDAQEAARSNKQALRDDFFRAAREQAAQAPPAAYDSPLGAPGSL